MPTDKTTLSLSQKARDIRIQTLQMITRAGKGHIGGDFSCTDILVALYYGGVLKVDPARPDWPARDRFILSKGHACEALYCILADQGFFPETELTRYQQPGCILGGHPDRSIPGIEADTGSLGHGLGVGCGLALGARLDGKDYLTFVLLGDGECCEGAVWESAMFAARHKLGNLIAVIDNNGMCVTDRLEDCTALEPLAEKWRAFGWDVQEVDGHDFNSLLSALSGVRDRVSSTPLMVVARTVKGKGVPFMEGRLEWHHGVPKGEKAAQALRALKEMEC
ncbi:MAG TPA: transketolase [Candidatus Omnitrophota bacterium]|jgi:transketolase|nr:transketolase [Candidatus Omnitrophota bacterium]